jgi:hypothetical protein
MYAILRVLLIIFTAQSFQVNYDKLGMKPKRTPLLVEKKKEAHLTLTDSNLADALDRNVYNILSTNANRLCSLRLCLLLQKQNNLHPRRLL